MNRLTVIIFFTLAILAKLFVFKFTEKIFNTEATINSCQIKTILAIINAMLL